jgi:D-glycerate 3-kinase
MASHGSSFSGREQATLTEGTSTEHPTGSDNSGTPRPAQSSVDTKTAHILSFLTPLITAHTGTSDLTSTLTSPKAPFFLGLNGIQGAGKTTLVRTLADKLRNVPYSLPTAVLSIDDLYLPHTEQNSLANSHPNNALIQHRGQPGTHDVQLGVQLFENLKAGRKTKIPAYDKSAFNGEGDRAPEMEWETVNDATNEQKLKVVIFEGWCVGFRPLEKSQVADKWRAATEARKTGSYHGRLGFNELSNVEFINGSLRNYDQLTE